MDKSANSERTEPGGSSASAIKQVRLFKQSMSQNQEIFHAYRDVDESG